MFRMQRLKAAVTHSKNRAAPPKLLIYKELTVHQCGHWKDFRQRRTGASCRLGLLEQGAACWSTKGYSVVCARRWRS